MKLEKVETERLNKCLRHIYRDIQECNLRSAREKVGLLGEVLDELIERYGEKSD